MLVASVFQWSLPRRSEYLPRGCTCRKGCVVEAGHAKSLAMAMAVDGGRAGIDDDYLEAMRRAASLPPPPPSRGISMTLRRHERLRLRAALRAIAGTARRPPRCRPSAQAGRTHRRSGPPDWR